MKEKIKKLVSDDPINTIGKALVHLFNNQVESERSSNHTRYKNGVGFSANDARIGSLGAKYFLKHKTLQDWQLKPWIKEVNGYPRICKYARQLEGLFEDEPDFYSEKAVRNFFATSFFN